MPPSRVMIGVCAYNEENNSARESEGEVIRDRFIEVAKTFRGVLSSCFQLAIFREP
jgi:hypothetical protein